MRMTESAARIELEHVGVQFPVFNAASLSLKNRVLSSVTGGRIERERDRHVLVRGLDDLSFTLSSGERLGLVGHNGSGKTTLLRVLAGIFAPTEGAITIQGHATALINIGLGIDPEATGRENIWLRSAMMGIPPQQTRACMEEIIAFSGLGDFIDMPFRTYSSGMQMRLAFSVSTATQPQILIMDEWLSTGDEAFRTRAEERMNEMLAGTEIMILASHDPNLIRHTCSRVIWLEHGRIRQDGPPESVIPAYFGVSP